jgi:hypothetical protein
MASAALMAGSVVSTGGIAALAVRVVRGFTGGAKENSKQSIAQSGIKQSDIEQITIEQIGIEQSK